MKKRALQFGSLFAGVFLLGGAAKSADLSTAPKELPAEAKAPDALIGFAFYSQYATDYNFRGVSQSNRQGSYQTFFEMQLLNNLAYAGFYTWQARLPSQPDFEFDLVAGVRPTFGKFSFDLGVTYYYYPNEKRILNAGNGAFLTTANNDFIEYAAKGLYQVNPELVVGANVFYAPSFFGQHYEATYTAGTIAYTLPASWFSFLPETYAGGFAMSGEGGHYFLGAAKSSAYGFTPSVNIASYNYGNVGLSYTYKNILVDLRFHTTDLTPRDCYTFTGDYRGVLNGGRSGWCGDAIIGSIRWQASTANPGVYAEPGGIMNIFK